MAVVEYRALVQKAHERLVEVQHTQIAQGLNEEAGVEQVHDRVFDAAGVLVNGVPQIQHVGVEGAVLEVRAGVAQEVPGGINEGVHRVGLAFSERSAVGTGRVDEVLVDRQG